MTVQCPRCRTQYKIPSARISDPRPVFKCTRCSLVFSREAERGPRPTTRSRDEEKNLPLPFSSRKERDSEPRIVQNEALAGEDDLTLTDEDEVEEGALGDDEADEEAASEEEEGGADADEEPARPSRRQQRPATVRDSAREKEPAFVASASRERLTPPRSRSRREDLRFREEEELDDGPTEGLTDDDEEPKRPVLVASEGKQRRPPINPRRDIRSASASVGRSPLKPVAIGVAVIAAVYLVIAVSLDRRPEQTLESLSQVPLLGRMMGGDHLLVWRLQLENVEGSLDQIKGARPAYVVSGRAINTSNEDLRIIEIEGRLLASGTERRRQTVYAANQQRKTIQDLSPSEVEMLLRLEPNRRFVIRPGESASFLLVFPDPPSDTTEVTCRVVNARAA